MERRTAFAGTGALTASVMAGALALGASVGVFGPGGAAVARRRACGGRQDPVHRRGRAGGVWPGRDRAQIDPHGW